MKKRECKLCNTVMVFDDRENGKGIEGGRTWKRKGKRRGGVFVQREDVRSQKRKQSGSTPFVMWFVFLLLEYVFSNLGC